MYLKVHVAIWICIIYILYSRGELTETQQKDIDTYVNDFCHIKNKCDESISSPADAEKLIGNTCCKGCPCGHYCSAERTSDGFAKFTECLKPTPYNRTVNEKMLVYKFVAKEPKAGCVKNIQLQMDEVLPTCNIGIVTALGGNIYPVYSYDKKVNFKNRNCALCHGAKDLVHWDVYSLYIGNKKRKFEVITNNLKIFNSTDIFTWFVAPNRESRDYTKICFDIKDHCKADNEVKINIPDGVNMTVHQVKEACEHGPRFFFMKDYNVWFKNIFCAFCNGAPFKKSDLEYCENKFFSDGTRRNVNSFTYLMRRDFISAEIEKSPKDERKRIWACSKEGEHMDQDHCREIICPLLQTRLLDGRCDYPFDIFNINKVILNLNLSSTTRVKDDVLSNMTFDDIKRMFETKSPWQRFWTIISVLKRTDVTQRLEFLVIIGWVPGGPMNIHTFERFLKMALSKFWIIELPLNNPISLLQTFHIHGTIKRDRTITEIFLGKPSWTIGGKVLPFLSKLERPSWTGIFLDNGVFHKTNLGDTVRIEKLFLCPQVFLKSSEYSLKENGFPLYLNQEREYLYPGEYFVYGDGYKGDTIAVCLEDSGFQLFEHFNAAIQTGTCYDFLILLLGFDGLFLISHFL